ncbi:excinuclease ABC subunit B [Leifsonia xyli subsp. cynodontis DSM 46306]|jgi:hypothetical protein|uniref:Uncharacterized protein n=1 Tax=Leifsonia xyli subsp. cynodontis DSM 46306 TaxID=1389489 RepID=U3PD34_LEIXC|nr:excinuclease ABC subunit B [Leifsonia xyli subsp. cynodontis DSM 46306]
MSTSSSAQSDRIELANAYLSALKAHMQLTVPPPTGLERVLRYAGSARRRRELEDLEHDLRNLARQMREQGVGFRWRERP